MDVDVDLVTADLGGGDAGGNNAGAPNPEAAALQRLMDKLREESERERWRCERLMVD